MTCSRVLAALALLATLPAQEPGGERAIERPLPPTPKVAPQEPEPEDPEVVLDRCRELTVAQQRGTLTVEQVVKALGGHHEPVARTAAAIVRHQWAELPAALFAALADSPDGSRMLLRELAAAPRPAAAEWAALRTTELPGRTLDDRCLALAARGTPLRVAEAELLLAAIAAGEVDEGFYAALHVLSDKVADGLLGRIHAGLQQNTLPLERVLPLLDRMSDKGVRGLLGLVRTLPDCAPQLVSFVHERRRELVLAQAADALDAPGELETAWVPYGAPVLDRPERIARVRALLGDDTPPPLRQHAFLALVEAGAVDDAVLDYAAREDNGTGPRLRRVLDIAIDRVPAARILHWLDLDTETSKLVVKALSRRSKLEPELEERLVADLQAAGTVDGEFWRPATLAIVYRGSAAALHGIQELLRTSIGWSEFLDALGRRREPFVHELLLTELQAEVRNVPAAVRQQQLDDVALALTALGDRRELQRLVDRAPGADTAFVRRCAHHVRPLPAPFAVTLLERALAKESKIDPDTALELVTWASTAHADADVRRRLLAIWQQPPPLECAEELQEVALRALAASEHRSVLVGELRAAIAQGPLPDRLEPLTFELLASMAQPPTEADLQLCADLLLLGPRTDPEREAHQAQRWPDGTFGFPLVAAIAERLRAADPVAVAKVFDAAAAATMADPRHVAIAPARLLVIWRELAVAPAVQRAVAEPTAAPFLLLPGREQVGVGPAHWFAAQAAARRGDLAAARNHALAARDGLLLLPSWRRHARVFLGDRDPSAGRDPWAALAALPHRYAFDAARASGDAAAAAAAARLVREFAGHDVSLLSNLPTSPLETVR